MKMARRWSLLLISFLASFASMSQSGIGSLQAGSTLSTLQSAAMGGYGAAAVSGATRALLVVSEGVVAVIKRLLE